MTVLNDPIPVPAYALHRPVLKHGPLWAGVLEWWELCGRPNWTLWGIWFERPYSEAVRIALRERKPWPPSFLPLNPYCSEKQVWESSDGRLIHCQAMILALASENETYQVIAAQPVYPNRSVRDWAIEEFRLWFTYQPKIVRRPILGLRWWYINMDGFLISPFRKSLWLSAMMTADRWTVSDAVQGETGIHATWVPRRWNWRRDDSPPYLTFDGPLNGFRGPALAYGLVQAVGRDYVLGTKGWRARKVLVLKVWVRCCRRHFEAVEQMYPEVTVINESKKDSCT